MYEYWSNEGELYFIEFFDGNNFVIIGDVTFCEYDLPIVIGNKKYQNKGIGPKVVEGLLNRARYLNFKEVYVEEIYDWNI